MQPPEFTLAPVSAADADALADMRVQAMRDSLEAVGRFDPQRARERFLVSFDPRFTRAVVVGGTRVGFVAVRPDGEGMLLDHLYLLPAAQGRGLGSAVLRRVLAEADLHRKALRVGALKGSDANRFYRRHGFEQVAEGEFDLYYLRPAQLLSPSSA